MKRACLVWLGITLLASCSDVLAPTTAMEYALESVAGQPLPVVLLTDYDIKVSVRSDVITLRSDSTFLEVATFEGLGNAASLTTTDSVSGTWTVSGTTLYLLTTSAQATRMVMSGNTLTQDFGSGTLVYRRR
jgi:hypothetical protein